MLLPVVEVINFDRIATLYYSTHWNGDRCFLVGLGWLPSLCRKGLKMTPNDVIPAQQQCCCHSSKVKQSFKLGEFSALTVETVLLQVDSGHKTSKRSHKDAT